MAIHSRDTLKNMFRHGEMPAQDAFGALIESMLNIVDQQFDKTPRDGLKVGQIGDGRLLSFYNDISHKSAIWSVQLDQQSDSLVFGTGTGTGADDDLHGQAGFRKAMELSPLKQSVGFAPLTGAPRDNDLRFQLDLQGRLVADGRQGRAAATVAADGEWHDITHDLTGCHAFEVVAGTGKQDSGKYAVMHAYALSAFQGGKSDITYHQAHCGTKCVRMELRWTKQTAQAKDPYRLQIRTCCAIDERDTRPEQRTGIRVYLMQLWFDPAMEACRPQAWQSAR